MLQGIDRIKMILPSVLEKLNVSTINETQIFCQDSTDTQKKCEAKFFKVTSCRGRDDCSNFFYKAISRST